MLRFQILICFTALVSASRLMRRELGVTASDTEAFNVVFSQTRLTCANGDQKISQPCDGGAGTGCSYETCMQACLDEVECNFFFHITSTSGCILYRSCDETRIPSYTGTTVEIMHLNVLHYDSDMTCFNGDQKISQPCNGGEGTGCTYDACMQHCFDEEECNFFFHITSTLGCILYRSCEETRDPAYSGTTVEVMDLNILHYDSDITCFNGDQKISQPCDGGEGTGCTYDVCKQHCFDEAECNFFFHITSTLGCILYRSCDETRTPAYSGTTVEVTLRHFFAPTANPSVSPSRIPSASPSKSPTTQPSETPSTSPTTQPTTSPSTSPTTQPSASPSTSPTTRPSESPSMSPTTRPSGSPSKSPTARPSESPSKSPTAQPSVSPSTESPTTHPSRSPSFSMPSSVPTGAPTLSEQGLNVIHYDAKVTCENGDQKISQPCNGGTDTGCSFDACVQHCFDEEECNFFFHITSTSGCILYRSCDETRVPTYSGTTVEIMNLNVVYYQADVTCFNGEQKISQPCNGGEGTGCSYDACMQHCFDEEECNFFFHIISTSGCILYNSCDDIRTPAYSGHTIEVFRPTAMPTQLPTQAPTGLNVVYYETKLTCSNGEQKISQPCNGGKGTGCSYDACMQHCFAEDECDFFFHITSTSGCILYNSCDETRTPAYAGTTVQITRQ